MKSFNDFKLEGKANSLKDDIIDLLKDFKDETDIEYVRTDCGYMGDVNGRNLVAQMPAILRGAVYQEAIDIRFIRKTKDYIQSNEDRHKEYLLVDDQFESDSQKISEFITRLRQMDSQISVYLYWYMDEQSVLVVLPKS